MLLDYHCHSHCSDGELSPEQLIQLAEQNDVEVLAITDHDTIGAYKKLPDTHIKIVSGIEFSTCWNKIGVHIVGLNIDLHSKELLKAINLQQKARKYRAEIISKKLEKVGLIGAYEKLNHKKHIGRPDFAKLLVEADICKNQQHAFKQYLGAGKIGDVKNEWLSFEEVIAVINHAGGVAVLAHPLYYKLTNAKLNRLVSYFVVAGGQAIEVINGYQNLDKTKYLAKLAGFHKLKSSIGSDFHYKEGWSKLGVNSNLVENLLTFSHQEY